MTKTSTLQVIQIEDDPGAARYNEIMIAQAGIPARFRTLFTGDEAVAFFSGEPEGELNGHTVILLDLNLPGMDGCDVLQFLRRREATKRTPVIVVTSSVEDGDRVRCIDLGADEYLTKPVEAYQFHQILAGLGLAS